MATPEQLELAEDLDGARFVRYSTPLRQMWVWFGGDRVAVWDLEDGAGSRLWYIFEKGETPTVVQVEEAVDAAIERALRARGVGG